MARATDGLLHSTLRELRAYLTRRPVVVGALGLGLILGVSGPFNTFEALATLPRIAYWVTVVIVTFAAGSFSALLVQKTLGKRPLWLRLTASTLVIGLVVTVVVILVNRASFGIWPESWAALLQQLGIVTFIAAVIEIGGAALRGGAQAKPEAGPSVLDRLPLEKRGALIALSAEDHYVRVTTSKGEELVLMRLSDAMKELGRTDGLQIHRSHWVARFAIESAKRSGDRGEVTVQGGATFPISRGFMPAVVEAGLLPKGRRS